MSGQDSMENMAIISIGSNIDADINITRMISLLRQYMHITAISPLARTSPVGMTNQPDYTNGAVRIITHLDKDQLKKILKRIEDDLGRDRSLPAFGPRTMDLDIVVWNNKIVDDDYHTRDFLRNSVDYLWPIQGA